MTATSTCNRPMSGREATATMQPMVTVVIPVRNDARRLAVCLASLDQQYYPRDCFEVIVIDNGSTDDSIDVAQRHCANVLRFPGLRVGALRNRGIAAAAGKIIALVDSDHELPDNWLTEGVRQLTADDHIRAVGHPCLAPANGTWVQRGWQVHRLRQRERRAVRWLGSGNLFFWRDDFNRAGGFSETLVAAEDVDLCQRLARSGQIVSDPHIANIHHGEPRTLRDFFWKEYWRGSSGLLAFIKQGMPLEELPSLLYPLYHLCAVMAVAASIPVAVGLGSPSYLVAALVVLSLPAVLMSAKTSWQVRGVRSFPTLAVLYFVYGLSRAAALFKR